MIVGWMEWYGMTSQQLMSRWSFSHRSLLTKLTFAPKRRLYARFKAIHFLCLNSTTRNPSTKSEFEFEFVQNTTFQPMVLIQLVSLTFGIPEIPINAHYIRCIGWLLRVPSQGYHHFPHDKDELKPSRQEPAEVLSIFVSSFERSDIGGVTPPTELPDGSFLVTWCWMFGQRKAFHIWTCFCSWVFVCFCLHFQMFDIQKFMLCIVLLFAKSMLQSCFPWIWQFVCDFKV